MCCFLSVFQLSTLEGRKALSVDAHRLEESEHPPPNPGRPSHRPGPQSHGGFRKTFRNLVSALWAAARRGHRPNPGRFFSSSVERLISFQDLSFSGSRIPATLVLFYRVWYLLQMSVEMPSCHVLSPSVERTRGMSRLLRVPNKVQRSAFLLGYPSSRATPWAEGGSRSAEKPQEGCRYQIKNLRCKDLNSLNQISFPTPGGRRKRVARARAGCR